jgi:hypothetical protein
MGAVVAYQPWLNGERDVGYFNRHSGAMRSIEPGISRFPDVRLHI